MRVMRKQLVKRSLDMLKDISKRPAGRLRPERLRHPSGR